jgi:hypothetical protein
MSGGLRLAQRPAYDACGHCGVASIRGGTDTDGEAWPTSVETEDGETRSWRHLLLANLAEILPELSSVAS